MCGCLAGSSEFKNAMPAFLAWHGISPHAFSEVLCTTLFLRKAETSFALFGPSVKDLGQYFARGDS